SVCWSTKSDRDIATELTSSPYAFICWIEASTTALNTPLTRLDTKAGKSTSLTSLAIWVMPAAVDSAWKRSSGVHFCGTCAPGAPGGPPGGIGPVGAVGQVGSA